MIVIMTTIRQKAINSLEKRIKLANARLETTQECQNKDFKIFMSTYAEEQYAIISDLEHLTDILQYINSSTETDDEVAKYLVKVKNGFVDLILNNCLMETSNSPMYNLTTLWDNESLQRIIKIINYILL